MADPTVRIYDTTLRDGAQAEGISFSSTDKLLICRQLDEFGVHYVEGGWPGSNPKDMDFFHEIRRAELRRTKVAAFGSTRRAGGTAADDPNVRALVEAGTAVVTLFGKSWMLHVRDVLRTSAEENLAMIADTVRFFKERGREVLYDAEHFFDGCRDDAEYAMRTLQAAVEAGADWLVLCDTNGGSLPWDVARIVEETAARFPDVPIGIHTHNDAELAVANSLVAVERGASMVQGTVNGYGERCGNANLVSILPALVLKMGIEAVPRDKLRELRALSMFIDELANVRHNNRAPYVGQSAFAHKGGMHVNAVGKNARTFEHIEPESVGNRRRVLVSELAGRSNILLKARELDIPLDEDGAEARAVLDRIKELEHEGYEYEAADASFQLVAARVLNRYRPFFDLDAFRVIVEKRAADEPCISEATIKLHVDGREEHTAAEGDGPVNALDRALRKALTKFYPAIGGMQLVDFKVRILDPQSGTGAKTRVLIESSDGESIWGTVGVSDNIIEASWQAVVDSVEYKLFRDMNRKSEAGNA